MSSGGLILSCTLPFSPEGASAVAEFEQNPEYQVPWLPLGIRVTLEDGTVEVAEDAQNPVYELVATVVFVKDENEEKCNLVAVIRFGTEWNLFNDFM